MKSYTENQNREAIIVADGERKRSSTEARPVFHKILCPIDFSDNSMAALDQAAKLAQKDDAMLYLMHVEFVPMSNPAELAQYDITLRPNLVSSG